MVDCVFKKHRKPFQLCGERLAARVLISLWKNYFFDRIVVTQPMKLLEIGFDLFTAPRHYSRSSYGERDS